MKPITIDFSKTPPSVRPREVAELLEKNRAPIRNALSPIRGKTDSLGWVDVDTLADRELLTLIEDKAKEIRENAEAFVLIGVGGSNQGARAAVEALGDNRVEILYTGNTLSPASLNKTMAQLKGKSVYVNVIAKNFATLEPGATFRVIRHYLEEEYGLQEAAKRTIATCSPNNGSLELFARDRNYTVLPFPLDVEGRYSVLSAAGLLPMGVAGIDIGALLNGAREMKELIHSEGPETNPAVLYALHRNLLLKKGYAIEILSHFEPAFHYFAKWWVQLFAESEGKDGKGIYPTSCSFSEDLHSLGQYIQDGRRILLETFLNLEDQGASYAVPHEDDNRDGFAYVDGKDFAFLNRVAFNATINAHRAGGVPCAVVNVPELTPYYMGQLFYFFEYACYVSGAILGVNPFDQPAVETYKVDMFNGLGRRQISQMEETAKGPKSESPE